MQFANVYYDEWQVSVSWHFVSVNEKSMVIVGDVRANVFFFFLVKTQTLWYPRYWCSRREHKTMTSQAAFYSYLGTQIQKWKILVTLLRVCFCVCVCVLCVRVCMFLVLFFFLSFFLFRSSQQRSHISVYRYYNKTFIEAWLPRKLANTWERIVLTAFVALYVYLVIAYIYFFHLSFSLFFFSFELTSTWKTGFVAFKAFYKTQYIHNKSRIRFSIS